jgi:hypothetical protein
VIHDRDGQVARQGVGQKPVKRFVEVRKFVLAGSRHEQRQVRPEIGD